MAKDAELKEFLKLFFEVGQLKQIKRAGWNLLGIENAETVAEHSWRASVIAYFLAQYEDADPYKSAAMCLLHDLSETRIGDHHKVSQRYIEKAEEKVMKDQLKNLPQWASDRVIDHFNHYAKDTSKEGTIARDADLLECAITAKEYIDRGFPDAIDWINNVDTILKTATAKKLNKMILKSDSNSWWKSLKKITR
jgi:putative hydrolase of HD superfamily